MEGACRETVTELDVNAPCSRCEASGCPWDRLGVRAVCPDCQEVLALGEGRPLIERLLPRRCVACDGAGTVPYLTFPLHAAAPLALDLCVRHFRALLGRRLDRATFHALGRHLQALGLKAGQVFLLHEAFYDDNGRPLQPVRVW